VTHLSRRTALKATARFGLYASALSPLARGFVQSAHAAENKPWFLLYKIGGGTQVRCAPSIGAGKNYTLSPYFQPLEPLKSEMIFVQGIRNQAFIEWLGKDDGGHDAGAVGMSGRAPLSPPKLKEVQFVGGPTFDRTFAQHLSHDFPLPSVDFSVGNDFGAPIGRFLFWRGPGQVVSQFTEPQKAFAQLFGGPATRGLDASVEQKLDDLVLNGVRQQLQAAKKLLGGKGAQTMEANLTALSEYQRNHRLLQQKLQTLAVDSKFVEPPRDSSGKLLSPSDSLAFPQLLSQFAELAAIALDLGLTRVVTLQLSDSYGTNFTFPFLNGRNGLTFAGDLHFTYGHEFFERRAHRLVIEHWFSEVFLGIVNRLKRNASATLANGCAVMLHQMEHSPHHRVGLLPAVVVGAANGRLKQGQLVNLYGARTGGSEFLPDYDESAARTTNEFFMTLGKALQVPGDSMGDPQYCKRGPIQEALT
jgi:hypothetical protein